MVSHIGLYPIKNTHKLETQIPESPGISGKRHHKCILSFHQPLQPTQKQNMNHLQLWSIYTRNWSIRHLWFMYNGGIFLSYMLVLRLWQMLTLVKEYHKKPFNYTIYYPKTICYIKHFMLKYHHEFFFFFLKESFNLWHLFLMIIFYH